MKDSGFWEVVQRFKTLVELIATLIVVVPLVIVLVQQGFQAVMPVWLVVLIVAFAVVLGYMLGRKASATLPQTIAHRGRLLQRIDFDYSDSPAAHGWNIGDNDKDKTQPVLRHFLDGFVGNALEIQSTVWYSMDLDVDQVTGLGSCVDFVIKPKGEAYTMTRMLVYSKDDAKYRRLWLSFYAGIGQPKRVDDGRSEGWFEYVVPIKPIRLDGGWGVLQVNLREAVQKTAGALGWKYGQLECIRFRGNLSVSHIAIYE
ncbi:MAG: hypothetical protein NT169_09280 [Chloroflexi bacterium]|nr:hypothetical protein [Chloroflexota bacterium]